jgi:nicotinamidase-related amidase
VPEPAPLDPQRTALLVMDYQPAIVAIAGDDADALVARAAAAIGRAREAGAHVGYVRVALTPEDRAAIPGRNRAFSQLAQSDRLTHGDPDIDVHPELSPVDGDVVVRKTRVGAFSTTDLAGELAARGVDTLVLAGISTSGVVLSTTRDAADRDFRLLVLADCCADPDPDVHRVLIEKVLPRQAEVIDLETFAGMLAA